jgi:hypothetical protein
VLKLLWGDGGALKKVEGCVAELKGVVVRN